MKNKESYLTCPILIAFISYALEVDRKLDDAHDILCDMVDHPFQNSDDNFKIQAYRYSAIYEESIGVKTNMINIRKEFCKAYLCKGCSIR